MIAYIVARYASHFDPEDGMALLRVINVPTTAQLWGARWEIHEDIDLTHLRCPLFPGWTPYARDVRTGDGTIVPETLWGYPITRHVHADRAVAFVYDRQLATPPAQLDEEVETLIRETGSVTDAHAALDSVIAEQLECRGQHLLGCVRCDVLRSLAGLTNSST